MESFSFFSINQPFFVCLYRLFSVLVYYSGPEGARVKVPPVFCYCYLCLLCYKFPARLQSLNSVTKPEMNISRFGAKNVARGVSLDTNISKKSSRFLSGNSHQNS